MTKILITAIMALAPITGILAEEDCFYRFAYRMNANLGSGVKYFECDEVRMETEYSSNLAEKTNLDNVYAEILRLNDEVLNKGKVLTCKHSCEYNDVTDYSGSKVYKIEFLKEKWCMMNPDSAGKADEELIFSYDALDLAVKVDTYRKPKPYIAQPYSRGTRPFEKKKVYTEDDYIRP